jgi:hypothetical protein
VCTRACAGDVRLVDNTALNSVIGPCLDPLEFGPYLRAPPPVSLHSMLIFSG